MTDTQTYDTQTVQQWIGRTLVDSDGDKIGTIADVYLDEATRQPEWFAVKTGMFGGKVSFVPIPGATVSGDDLSVQWSKDHVKDAPHAEPDGALSEQEEQALYQHYQRDWSGDGWGDAGRDTSGPTTDSAMTRSEEELKVGTTEREKGRARLRTYVVTEHVQTTVPVRREEVVVEREPITDANVDQAMDGPVISDEEHEVVLHEEEVVVEKRAVPKERVRLGKEVVVEEQQVGADVRKEQLSLEGDAEPS